MCSFIEREDILTFHTSRLQLPPLPIRPHLPLDTMEALLTRSNDTAVPAQDVLRDVVAVRLRDDNARRKFVHGVLFGRRRAFLVKRPVIVLAKDDVAQVLSRAAVKAVF